MIIGKEGFRIKKENALDHVAGYSIFNDASVRDFQLRASQWTVGKNFDASGGFGPWLVSPDELPPGAKGLQLQTRLNGRVVQNSNTKHLIFDVAAQIAYLSQAMTLRPGDLFITGTPSGVGFSLTPPGFMKAGDVCEVEIQGIGVLRNPVAEH
jgi:2-keto-4-pentenoate hydratase/2-oxohepta-3-ene-1,7-dioic acid hydratase in catechol pathway